MIKLEELNHEDYGLVAAWLSNPEVNQWLIDWRGKVVTERIIAVVSMSPKNELFMVTSDGRKCGVVALANIDLNLRAAEIWYFLGDSSFKGQGVTSIGIGLLLDQCFSRLGLSTLTAQTMTSNTPSIRLLRRHGFEETGLLNSGELQAGEEYPRIGFELGVSRWRQMRSDATDGSTQ